MKEIKAGGNTLIDQSSVTVSIHHSFKAGFKSEVDTSTFMLKADGKVRSDEDFIFYNQPKSADGSVEQVRPGVFGISLDKVPSEIDKLAVTMVIDGPDNFSQSEQVKLVVDGVAYFELKADAMTEKAIILGQFYRHNGKWKFKAIGSGFNGGLAPLATAYGVTVADDEAEAPAPTPQPEKPVDIEEKLRIKLQKEAPKLISLAKPVAINLKKHKMETAKARVAFILDASGSMSGQFRSGNVQAVLERIVPLSLQFDDDGEMEFWSFACRQAKYENVTARNFEGYIERAQKVDTRGGSRFFPSNNIMKGLGWSNNEKLVMREVIDFVKGLDSSIPTYVVFITDGGITDSRSIEDLIRESERLPIFWQFVGLGGSNYGILERLDDLVGRSIDNSDFFNIDDFQRMSDDEVYANLLNEFPGWFKEAKQKGIIG